MLTAGAARAVSEELHEVSGGRLGSDMGHAVTSRIESSLVVTLAPGKIGRAHV